MPESSQAVSSMADGNPRLKEYAAEVHSIKSDIDLLKSKFYERQKQRAKLRDASKVLAELGQVIDWRNPVETDGLKELQSIVATELLDPASTLPISADALHKKVCNWPPSMITFSSPEQVPLLHQP